MSVVLIGDSRIVFGFPPELPLELAPSVLRYKIRARSKEFARIFLKIANPDDPLQARWQEWYLGSDGNNLFPWIRKGENISAFRAAGYRGDKFKPTWQKA